MPYKQKPSSLEELRESLEFIASAAAIYGEDHQRTTSRIDGALKLFRSHMEAVNEKAIGKFCADMQHKVELSFKLVAPGHLVMPWENTVRPIIYKRAKSYLEGDKTNHE